MRIIREGHRRILPAAAVVAALLIGGAAGAFGTCGPFTDVVADTFCPFVLEIFTLAVTTGTTATTYSPGQDVTRLQMAAFLSRTVDRAVQRGGRRAALKKFWTPQNAAIGLTTIGDGPIGVVSDGVDLWAAATADNTVVRVSGSGGKVLETWPGTISPAGVLAAMGQIIVTGNFPTRLYTIDPRVAPGSATIVATNLGGTAGMLTFDGGRVWTVNANGASGSVSIVTPAASPPWTVTTVTTGFGVLFGTLFDGSNVWVTDATAGKLHKLDSAGAILQSVTVGLTPFYPVFDGTNIWVPSTAPSVTVVRAATGAILATLTGNGLVTSHGAAFDGERVLITNEFGNSVSLFKAADLSPLGSFPLGASTQPLIACSDGVSFWITLNLAGQLARF
jgi:hypothetical protein